MTKWTLSSYSFGSSICKSLPNEKMKSQHNNVTDIAPTGSLSTIQATLTSAPMTQARRPICITPESPAYSGRSFLTHNSQKHKSAQPDKDGLDELKPWQNIKQLLKTPNLRYQTHNMEYGRIQTRSAKKAAGIRFEVFPESAYPDYMKT